jgi:hypothetical protein
MSKFIDTSRKSKAQRDLDRAADMLRRPGARLCLMHAGASKQFYIVPGGAVSHEIAGKLIDRPDVCGQHDGLFPGCDQTWRFA